MFKIEQDVNNNNKDAILSRYLTLGWGLESLRGCNDQILKLYLVWLSEAPPVYPEISDLI